MTKLQNLAKMMNVTEQQAFTFATCIRYQMKKGLSMEQAVEQHMKTLAEMVRLAKEDDASLRGMCADAVQGR